MSGRKKYSNELKLQIAHDYENGNGGYTALSRNYDINRTIIQRWVHRYNENGVDGLCKVRRTYDGDFKISVVEYMHKHSMSIKQAAIHFNIQSMATVSNWERIYYEKGKAALYEENRGRSKMKTKKITKPKKDIEQRVFISC